jgi:drug/metabolite transporter (DMT)-like permease
VSPPLAVITVTDPLVGIGIGVLWLDERLSDTPGRVVGQVLGLAAMALGVWLVAHRAPHLSAKARAEQEQAPAAGERRVRAAEGG